MMRWILAVTFVSSAHAEVSPHAHSKLTKITKEIQIAKVNLEVQEAKQRKVLTALYSISKNLKKLVTEKADLGQQKSLTELEIQGLNQKIEDSNRQAELQKAQLTERLRAIYKLKGPTLARFLFAAKNSAELERNLKILGIVAQRDSELIKTYRQSVQDLQYRKSKLTQKLARLQDVEADLKQKEDKLQTEMTQKNKILAGIRKTKMFTRDKIENLKSQSLSYDLSDSGLADLLTKPSFEAQRGSLPAPIQGVLAKSFGLIKQNDQHYVLSNKGLLIAAPYGSPVRAVFGGVVSFVGALPGLGQVLILDHGDHYYTVYGNNANVRVQLGDEVQQSQVIASSGRSSFDQKNALYFEVRHFSEPYNPTEWVKGFSL